MKESRERVLPRESDAWFEAHLEKLRNDKRWMELPGVDRASTPDETVFFDDLSDADQFNERFIESRVRQGASVSMTKLFVGIWLGWILGSIMLLAEGRVSVDGFFIVSCSILTLFVWACFKYGYPNPIRFNRQAQLVHIVILPSFKVVTIPWREVRPFICFQRDLWGSYNLELLFPYRQTVGKKTRNFPFKISGGFCSSDWSLAYSAAMRFEFIRLYMEKGLDAIPISEVAREIGTLTRPSGHVRKDPPDFDKDPISYIWRVWLNRLLVFPYVIDRIMERREANFRWPEEVEKLCEQGADLSGIDTSPVVARTDEYYYITPIGAPRFGTREELRQFRIAELRQQGLDPDGNPIPGFAEEQRKQAERERAAKEAQQQSEGEALARERAARRRGGVQTGATGKSRGGASWTPPGK